MWKCQYTENCGCLQYIDFLEGGDSESYHSKSKAKRVRTTFTEEQLQVLQANFQLDSNPDGQDLERIAQITGLSKRVTQVWFQNSRARQKKHLNTGKMKTSHCKLKNYFLIFLFIFLFKERPNSFFFLLSHSPWTNGLGEDVIQAE